MLKNRHFVYIALFMLICLPMMAAGQAHPQGYTIRGIVADSASGQGVAYATIGITDNKDMPVAAAYTAENGVFRITMQAGGKFTLNVSSVGYRTFSMPISTGEGKESISIDTIHLAATPQHLKEIQVISRKQLIEQQPGMLVYNAENDISNKGGTAADVLRKAPALNVDPQGNVSMRGNSNLKILINGKYSGQIARSPADALNMMPADIIKSVEIITTPSAKYDAEGAAGVINIITKKGDKSFSGALEVTGSNWEQAFNPRVSLSRDKWNMSLHGHLHRLRSKSAADMERISLKDGGPAIIINQQTTQDNVMPHGSAELALGYLPDSLSEISLNVNGWFGNWPDNSGQSSRIGLPDGTITDRYDQFISTKAKYLGADLSLGYTRKLRQYGQELTLLAQYSPSTENSSYYTNQWTTDKPVRYREENKSRTRNTEWTFQADYNQPLSADGRYTLQGGVKSIFRDAGNHYQVWATDNPPPAALEPQSDRSDDFVYTQSVLAGYLLMKMKLKRNWYAEAGARVEKTFLKGHFRATGTRFTNQFLNLVPTATITKKLNEEQTLTLSYTKRLTRPYIWDLNPNANASDPRNITVGNPSLEPEIMHQGELSYAWAAESGMFINAVLFGKQTDNTIIDLTTTDPEGVATTKKQNLAGNRQYGLNFSASFNLAPRWNVNGNINVNHLNYKSSAFLIVNNGWAGDINVNTMYRLPDNFALQAFGEYNTRIVTLQGYKTPRYYYSFSAKKELPENRMTITVTAINPFSRTIEQTDVMNTVAFISRVRNRYYNQAVKVTFNWEFGRMFEQGRKKKISNDDVKGQQKG